MNKNSLKNIKYLNFKKSHAGYYNNKTQHLLSNNIIEPLLNLIDVLNHFVVVVVRTRKLILLELNYYYSIYDYYCMLISIAK
jgi:hypothetical protein